MSETRILTEEGAERARREYYEHPGTVWSSAAGQRLFDSHEALRARLAAVEQRAEQAEARLAAVEQERDTLKAAVGALHNIQVGVEHLERWRAALTSATPSDDGSVR